jgi:hypothetical protein
MPQLSAPTPQEVPGMPSKGNQLLTGLSHALSVLAAGRAPRGGIPTTRGPERLAQRRADRQRIEEKNAAAEEQVRQINERYGIESLMDARNTAMSLGVLDSVADPNDINSYADAISKERARLQGVKEQPSERQTQAATETMMEITTFITGNSMMGIPTLEQQLAQGLSPDMARFKGEMMLRAAKMQMTPTQYEEILALWNGRALPIIKQFEGGGEAATTTTPTGPERSTSGMSPAGGLAGALSDKVPRGRRAPF